MFHCRCCDSTRLELVFDLGEQPWGNHFVPISGGEPVPRYPLQLLVCRDCAMAQIGHTVPKEVMFRHHRYLSGTTRSLRDHFDKVAAAIVARVPFGPGEYTLDIGGNDGTFLLRLKERGVAVLNAESGVWQADLSRQAGVECINDFFNQDLARRIRAEKGPAKAIHGSGIFFHLEELHSCFAGIKEVLAADGTLVAEFIYLPQMMKSCAFDQIYHEHLVYYSLSSFGELLRRHGLKIVDASLLPIHGGSCIAWITHAERDAAPSPALEALLAEERAMRLDDLEVYRDFARRAGKLRDTLVGLVRAFRAEGKSVYALGAPVKGSTIVNFCGFDHDDLECAVEINPLKVGTLVPGTAIPVLHQDTVKPPDVYLMLSWNFKDEILAKMDHFLAAGGKIIVPIPEPIIVDAAMARA